MLWVGVEDEGGVIASFAAGLEKAFGRAGFRQEGRALHSHLTLARFKIPQPVTEEIESCGPYDFDRTPFPVNEAVLFRSHLSPRGAAYEPLEKFPLA